MSATMLRLMRRRNIALGREDDQPRVGLSLGPGEQAGPLVEHVPPTRRGRLHREPEEGQRAFEDDDGGHGDQAEGHDRRHDVGQDLAGQDAGVARPERLGRQHEVAGGVGERRGPHDPVDERRAEDADDERDLPEAVAPERDDGDDGHDGREGQHHVGGGVEHRVDPSPPVGRDHGRDAADDQTEQRAAEADDERDPGPVDQAAEDVAVEIVGAEQVAPARAGVLHAVVVPEVGVGQRQQVGEGRQEGDEDDEAHADPEEDPELLLGGLRRLVGDKLLLEVGEGLGVDGDATHGRSSGRRW